MKRILCIGNGIAGVSAARELRKRCADEITLISDESDHFFARTALMYIYMGHLRYADTKPYQDAFWRKNLITLRRGQVTGVDPAQKQVQLADGASLTYDVLIIASGSKSNKFGWPGQELRGVQGLYHLQDLEAMERDTAGIERALIVGGGLIGVEMAEMLHSRGIAVCFLVRETGWMSHAFPPEEADAIARHIRGNGIDLRLSTELETIEGDASGRVCGVVTKGGERLPCQFVGLTVGVSPNIEFLRSSGIELDRGVLVDERLRTSAADVYAIGDCAQVRAPLPGRRPVEPLWYTGRIMGQTVARTICDQPTSYQPGIWFNSAKFFDLEWQVYGQIPARAEAGIETLYWEHHSGEQAIRINYRSEDRVVTGFNLLGIRYRHELCHEWLAGGQTLDFVLTHLGAANFDPEFYRQYEPELLALYNKRYPQRPLQLRQKRGLAGMIAARRAAGEGARPSDNAREY